MEPIWRIVPERSTFLTIPPNRFTPCVFKQQKKGELRFGGAHLVRGASCICQIEPISAANWSSIWRIMPNVQPSSRFRQIALPLQFFWKDQKAKEGGNYDWAEHAWFRGLRRIR